MDYQDFLAMREHKKQYDLLSKQLNSVINEIHGRLRSELTDWQEQAKSTYSIVEDETGKCSILLIWTVSERVAIHDYPSFPGGNGEFLYNEDRDKEVARLMIPAYALYEPYLNVWIAQTKLAKVAKIAKEAQDAVDKAQADLAKLEQP